MRWHGGQGLSQPKGSVCENVVYKPVTLLFSLFKYLCFAYIHACLFCLVAMEASRERAMGLYNEL